MSNLNEERVLSVRHWTDTLFSFTTTRNPTFRFKNGQFTMIGIPVEGRPLLRAYSLVSPNYEDTLEFLSIKVSDGPLTSRLQHLKEGDRTEGGDGQRSKQGQALADVECIEDPAAEDAAEDADDDRFEDTARCPAR